MSATTIRLSRVIGFLKANWFSVGLAIIFTLGLIQRYYSRPEEMRLHPVMHGPGVPDPAVKTEKYTDSGAPSSALGTLPRSVDLTEFRDPGKEAVQMFIKRFSKVAEEESRRYGVPASVILATGLVNSFAGTRESAKEANNYLGLPCAAASGEQFIEDGKCMLRTKTAWENFRTFSRVLHAQEWGKAAPPPSNTVAVRGYWFGKIEKSGLTDVRGFAHWAENMCRTYHISE